MGDQPADFLELMFAEPLGGPPLALLEALLIDEIAGPRRRERRAAWADGTARTLHLNAARGTGLARLPPPRHVEGQGRQTDGEEGDRGRLRDAGGVEHE